MNRPLKDNRARKQVATVRSIPSAVKGWNTEDPLSAMPPGYAVQLLNVIPRAGYVEPRRGSFTWTSSAPAPVETLLIARGDDGALDRIFAAAGSLITDVSSFGAWASAPVMASGFTSARWQYVNFSNAADRWIVAVNGEDDPQKFDGSSFSVASIYSASAASVVLDPTKLVTVTGHKSRLFFGEKGSLHVWYLAPFAVQGEAELLDIGPVCTLGGSVTAVATWSLDSGQGMDDMLVVATNQGQYVVYQGTDPADFTNWTLVGAFTAGKPIGRRCFQKYGGDLTVITTDGVQLLSVMLQQDRSQRDQVAVTAKIATQFNRVAEANATRFGWQATYYPEAALALYNVPLPGNIANQYVQNVQTGAWTQFDGWNAKCMEVANGLLYFGDRTGVKRGLFGYYDINEACEQFTINYAMQVAYSDFGTYSRQKMFLQVRPLIQATTPVFIEAQLLPDFAAWAPTYPLTTIDFDVMLWDVGRWDEDVWWTNEEGELETQREWQTVGAYAFTGSVAMGWSFNFGVDSYQMRIMSFDVIYEPGGLL